MPALSETASWVHGCLMGSDRDYSGVSTDTRTLEEGQLFVALQGPNFDGHDYIEKAGEMGAAAAIVSAPASDGISQIVVEDTRRALGQLASAWRSKHEVPTVAVTGSNGKTTLKEMIAACLSSQGATLSTSGNLNNDIGVPLMLMQLGAEHEYAVLELGANHIGEIAYLTSLVRPDVVVISNAGPAHLEGFGSLDGVARGKGEILEGQPRPRCAVLNADDHYFDFWTSLASDTRVISFSIERDADVTASDIQFESTGSRFTLNLPDGNLSVNLPLAGIHNVRNACAAAAVAHSLGMAAADIATSLESVEPVAGRLRPLAGLNGSTLLDDSYNANPLSVIAASEFLGSLPGRNIMVVSDMKELGDDEARMHRETGEKIAASNIDALLATGELSREIVAGFGANAEWHNDIDGLLESLQPQLAADVNVLVKGSRSMRMERVVQALRAEEAS